MLTGDDGSGGYDSYNDGFHVCDDDGDDDDDYNSGVS